MLPEAVAVWQEMQTSHWHNPSSPYRSAASARLKLDAYRTRLAVLLSVDPENIVFTSGATESNNTILAHLAATIKAPLSIAVSAVEHPSIVEAVRHWFGERIVWLSPDTNGIIPISTIADAVNQDVGAVVMMAANNETGILMPWQEAADICHSKGIPLLCDAAQWLGKLSATGLNRCHYLIGCAHKFGGPKGIGFHVTNAGPLPPLLWGGGQEQGQRGGTENLPAIAALVTALEIAEKHIRETGTPPHSWPRLFLAQLQDALPLMRIVGTDAPKLWNTVSLAMPYANNTRWVNKLDRLGFQISTGSACATAKTSPSHVLHAMGLPPETAHRVIRISSGWDTPKKAWEALAHAVISTANSLQSESSSSDVIVL